MPKFPFFSLQMEKFEREIRESKFAELMNKHFAATSIPKGIHCLSLRLTDEYSSNVHARVQLPSPELLPLLSDNSYHHFILSTDNVLAASVVVASAVQSSLKPEKIVFHVITDKKTYSAMHSWFALNPVSPAIIEVKGIHQFDWLMKENIPVLEAVENNKGVRTYYHGNHIAGAKLDDTTPRMFASKLQWKSPKYISLLNHLRIYIPEVIRVIKFSIRGSGEGLYLSLQSKAQLLGLLSFDILYNSLILGRKSRRIPAFPIVLVPLALVIR